MPEVPGPMAPDFSFIISVIFSLRPTYPKAENVNEGKRELKGLVLHLDGYVFQIRCLVYNPLPSMREARETRRELLDGTRAFSGLVQLHSLVESAIRGVIRSTLYLVCFLCFVCYKKYAVKFR